MVVVREDEAHCLCFNFEAGQTGIVWSDVCPDQADITPAGGLSLKRKMIEHEYFFQPFG